MQPVAPLTGKRLQPPLRRAAAAVGPGAHVPGPSSRSREVVEAVELGRIAPAEAGRPGDGPAAKLLRETAGPSMRTRAMRACSSLRVCLTCARVFVCVHVCRAADRTSRWREPGPSLCRRPGSLSWCNWLVHRTAGDLPKSRLPD